MGKKPLQMYYSNHHEIKTWDVKYCKCKIPVKDGRCKKYQVVQKKKKALNQRWKGKDTAGLGNWRELKKSLSIKLMSNMHVH